MLHLLRPPHFSGKLLQKEQIHETHTSLIIRRASGGHALEFQKDRQGLFRRGLDTIGPVFSIRLANKPAAVLIGPEYHQTFFMETDKKLSMHKTYQFLTAMFGQVAFAAPPEVYNEQRLILHSPFKHEKMVNYIKVMQIEIQQWLDSLGEQGEFELTSAMNTLVQNVAAHALMGKAFRDQMGREFWDLYLVLGASLDPLMPPNLPLPKFMRHDRAKGSCAPCCDPSWPSAVSTPKITTTAGLQDFVNARYKDGRPMEGETIISLILALVFAGHETTSGQVSWTIIQLLQNPIYLALVLQELGPTAPPSMCVPWAICRTSPGRWMRLLACTPPPTCSSARRKKTSRLAITASPRAGWCSSPPVQPNACRSGSQGRMAMTRCASLPAGRKIASTALPSSALAAACTSAPV